jgi:transketolase
MEVCRVNDKIKDVKKIKDFALEVRKNILEMAFEAGASSSHFGGALSITEIISLLFSHKMKIKKDDPNWIDRDRFILSKGHACLAYYAALCEVGYIKKEKLKTFEKDDSDLLGHPVINRDLGIDFSNGSLGMGLSLGIGVAIALNKKNKKNNVYVILGDGECNEGSVWEAAMAAPKFNLSNLYAIVDKNNFQQTGTSKEIMDTQDLHKKWSSFGWDAVKVDGNNVEDLYEVFNKDNTTSKPRAIIAETIKGKGFTFSENNNDWHHAVLSKALYEQGKKELI